MTQTNQATHRTKATHRVKATHRTKSTQRSGNFLPPGNLGNLPGLFNPTSNQFVTVVLPYILAGDLVIGNSASASSAFSQMTQGLKGYGYTANSQPKTTLVNAIGTLDTSLTVATVGQFPLKSSGPFTINIDTEANITASISPSGNVTWPIARPKAFSHLASANVFQSVSAFQNAASGGVAYWTSPVTATYFLYDFEHWAFTPPGEQNDILNAVASAAGLTHAASANFIPTPDRQFCNAGAASYAPLADLFVLQGQRIQQNLDPNGTNTGGSPSDSFVVFVTQAVNTIRVANPTCKIYASIGTGHGGPTAMYQALLAVQSIIDGWACVFVGTTAVQDFKGFMKLIRGV